MGFRVDTKFCIKRVIAVYESQIGLKGLPLTCAVCGTVNCTPFLMRVAP